MGMYTETRLKTAIHRRLHPFDFFLFSGGDVFSQARRIYKDISEISSASSGSLQARILNPRLIFKYLG